MIDIDRLKSLQAEVQEADPHDIHVRYENLHPFTDGNGQSGRALWLKMMMRTRSTCEQVNRLGFLHAFYYQTLNASDAWLRVEAGS